MPKKADLVGRTIHRLTIISESDTRISGAVTWLCSCSCGTNNVLATSKALLSGDKKSCGCLKKEVYRWTKGTQNKITHGMTKTPTYVCWKNMKARCRDVNHQSYGRYGGAGIDICTEWESFENFLEDMGEKPELLSLNSKNPAGNYCKENCEWATREQQALDTKKQRGVSTKYKGVCWVKKDQKYKASFRGKHLGYSDDPVYLAAVYDKEFKDQTGTENGTNKSLGYISVVLEDYLK